MTDHPYQAPVQICGYCNRFFRASTCNCRQQKRVYLARSRELAAAPRSEEVAVKRAVGFAFFGYGTQEGKR